MFPYLIFPEYVSHKRVRAAKIFSVIPGTGVNVETPDEDTLTVMDLPADIWARYQPVPGDYLVRYEDGYFSFSPAAAFEGGYTRVEP